MTCKRKVTAVYFGYKSVWKRRLTPPAGSKLTLANSQNASNFDYNLRVRKVSTSKRLRVTITHVSETKGNYLPVEKKSYKQNFSKCTKKLTSSPARSQKNLSLGIAPSTLLAESLRSFRPGKIEATLLKCPPPGGTLGLFRRGCAAGTLSLYHSLFK